MSRRSARLANKVVQSVFENNITEFKHASTESTRPYETKKRRTELDKKKPSLDSNKCSSNEKQGPENISDIKKENGYLSAGINEGVKDFTSTSAHIKTEAQILQHKINKEDKYIGAHVSISGGLHLAVERALEIGAKSFAMFLRSQRQWAAKPLKQEDADLFQVTCKESNFPPQVILPHGIYLMNCGSPDPETLGKSREVLIDELQRCEMLGLMLYNFHPGSTCGKISVDECLDLIAESINLAHQKTKYVITVLENMSCQGNTVGGKFVELRGIIDRVHDKSRVGVCLDTCHAFAAGYDLKTKEGFEKMLGEFELIVGLEYLKGVHLNDSKGELGCHLDRHENIGKGKIGKKGFQYLMQDKRFNGIPMVLETPCQSDDTYAKEIALLYSMQE